MVGVRAEGLKEVNPPATPDANQTTALVGARLIDGLGGAPIENAVVILGGNSINAVGGRDKVTIPDEAKRIDLSGLTLLPGLMDSHFHSINDLKTPVDYLLAKGVTSFRDPGHPFRFYQAVRQTEHAMPRVFLCGAHLDSYPAIWPQQAILIKDAQHARNTVFDHVDHGASAIKIYFRLPLEFHAPVCEAALQRGVPVTAHLELVDAADSIRAGVRGIEHVTSFGTSLAEPKEATRFKKQIRFDPTARKKLRHELWATIDLERSPRVQPLIDLIVEKNVFVSPTLAIFEKRLGEKGGTESEVRGFKNMLQFVGLCHKAGAKVVVGSHTSAPFAKSGEAYQRELELLVDAGMSPMEVIGSATIHNAFFFGAEDRLGSIEPGKVADLLVVDGDPSENIEAMKQVRYVMLNGEWIGDSLP